MLVGIKQQRTRQRINDLRRRLYVPTCSSQVCQVMLTPDNWAISSHRRPGVRRQPSALPTTGPTSAGRSRARRARRNAASAMRCAARRCLSSLNAVFPFRGGSAPTG